MKHSVSHVLPLLCLLMAACLCSWSAAAYDQKRAPQVNVIGEYYRGDGLGQNDGIKLKKDKTFFFSQSSDDGYQAEWSGTYSFKNNLIALFPSEESLLKKTPFPLQNLVAVSWGKRMYLIPEEEMRHFCNDINLGEEPRGELHGDYFVRLGSIKSQYELDSASSVPVLPASWKTFLLANPVTAPVTAVVHTGRTGERPNGEAGGEIIALTIHAGSRQGLKPGMLFFMHVTPDFAKKYFMGDQYATIQRVKPTECVAAFTTFVPDLPVKVGTSASTSLDKSTVAYNQHPPKPQTGTDGR